MSPISKTEISGKILPDGGILPDIPSAHAELETNGHCNSEGCSFGSKIFFIRKKLQW